MNLRGHKNLDMNGSEKALEVVRANDDEAWDGAAQSKERQVNNSWEAASELWRDEEGRQKHWHDPPISVIQAWGTHEV